MKSKNAIKSIIAVLLLVCVACASFACKKAEKPSRDKLPNQYLSQRYYFQQGYTNIWKISQQGEDGYLVDPNPETTNGLALQLVPLSRTESTDSEGKKTFTPGTDVIEGVQFNIFCNWGKGVQMTASQNSVLANVMNEKDSRYFFNYNNYIGDYRENYIQDEEAHDETYNKIQWKAVGFTFTADGDEWKGVWNLVMKGTDYYVISYEAKADLYDTYFAEFEEMMNDFKKVGWETEQ